jgi:hypothetical protein
VLRDLEERTRPNPIMARMVPWWKTMSGKKLVVGPLEMMPWLLLLLLKAPVGGRASSYHSRKVPSRKDLVRARQHLRT